MRCAFQHVEALERKGFVERGGRHIELVREYRPPIGIPVLGRVAAGSPILAPENIEDHIDLAGTLTDEDVFLLRGKGESMVDAGIHDGDYVVVHQRARLDPGEIGVVVINEEAVVKRVWQEGPWIWLVSENPAFKPLSFDTRENNVRIAGKVIAAFHWM